MKILSAGLSVDGEGAQWRFTDSEGVERGGKAQTRKQGLSVRANLELAIDELRKMLGPLDEADAEVARPWADGILTRDAMSRAREETGHFVTWDEFNKSIQMGAVSLRARQLGIEELELQNCLSGARAWLAGARHIRADHQRPPFEPFGDGRRITVDAEAVGAFMGCPDADPRLEYYARRVVDAFYAAFPPLVEVQRP